MQLTPDILKEIQNCATPEELITKANAAGIALTQAQAEKLLKNHSNGDLELDELDEVAGGASCDGQNVELVEGHTRACTRYGCDGMMALDNTVTPARYKCPVCGQTEAL